MIAFTPLLAAWFVNPALLGGLGLIALPILIHLLSRRRYRRIEWGATRFLLEAEKENRRRVRFEQWLLVALRCLVMALLALLVARPFVQPGLVASLLGGRGQVQRVIVIDDSASLAFRSGTTRDFALLREAGQRLLGWLHDGAAGDHVTVYLTSKPDEPLVAGERLSAATLEDLQARLGALEPTNLPARPRRVLETVAEDLLATGKGTHVDIYLLSDFQRSEWLATPGGDAGATDVAAGASPAELLGSVFEPLTRLEPDTVRVVLIASDVAARDNVALLDARLERPQTIAGLPAVLNATVVNYSRETLAGARVQVEVDGAPLPPVPVEPIAAGKSQMVSVEVTFPDEGFSELAIGVDTVDGLPADNTRQLALPIKDSLAVLLVNGQPATDPVRDEVYFPRNALAPAGPFASGISVQTIDPEEIEARALDAFDCVVLCNVAAPGPGAIAALQRYVRKGGGIVFFLGDEVDDPDEYNRVFHVGGEGLLPLPLKEIHRRDAGATHEAAGAIDVEAGAPADVGVGLVRTGDHPVTAMFPAVGAALSEYVRFRTYYRCGAGPRELEFAAPRGLKPAALQDRVALDERPPALILARFTDDARSPALVERGFGRGRVLLFTSSVDLDWNDWARAMDGSYVVTLLELVQYAARRGEDRLSFVAGETLSLSLLPEEYEPSCVFRAPPNEAAGASPDEQYEPAVEARVRGPIGAVGEPVVLEGPLATRLGTYTAELVRRGGGVELRPVTVNLDACESNLEAARAHELDMALGGVPHEYVEAAEAFPRDDEQTRRELWPAILLALVTILMLEQALAWWFGTPRHTARWPRRLARLFARSTAGGGARRDMGGPGRHLSGGGWG